jgi:glycine/D-amino acid oxidase-like deaminating enzyme
VLLGTVTRVALRDAEDGQQVVTGVHIEGLADSIPCDNICICMGPWSGVFIEDQFKMDVPMEGVLSTSVVYEGLSKIREEPFALFCEEDRNGCHLEVYPRNNGDIYLCGCGGSDYVAGDRLRSKGDCSSADKIAANPARVAAALASFRQITSLGDTAPTVTQACMRPCTKDGLPCMGPIPHVRGAYASFGHNCWGILWAPISGLCMAELMIEGRCRTVDLEPFQVGRFSKARQNDRGKKKGGVSVGEQW